MKFSVITPSYNSCATIEKAVESVLQQGYKNFEHIVVDGASNDGTVDLLKKYSHLKLVVEPDNGQVEAMQKGFQLARGAIIGNLNSDDFYKPDAFENILPHFKSGAEFVMGKVEVVSEHSQTNWINDPAFEMEKILRHWELNAFCVNPVGYFYRREVQETIPFNLENDDKHDLEFLMEVAARYNIKKIDVVLGVFSHLSKTKTSREQIRPSYWRCENFDFIEKFIKTMDEQNREHYLLEQQRGYQLRRYWSIQEARRFGREEELIHENEIFFLPEDEEDSLKSRCGFVEFDRMASRGDWVIPILTPGQVGDQDVYNALKNISQKILPAHIYHIHSVNPKTPASSRPLRIPYRAASGVGLALSQLYAKSGDSLKWKFITGIREPIGAAISSAFENKVPFNKLKNVVIDYARHIIFDYFNLNFQNPFGINILDCSFDCKKGYTILRKNGIEVLIYRFEDLSDVFPLAISEYFGVPKTEFSHDYISSSKKLTTNNDIYLNALSLEKSFLDEIYSSEIVKKIYTDEEIDCFFQRWTDSGLPKASNCFSKLKDFDNLLNYIIFFVPRSGSTLLAELLVKTNVFGNPQEWLNPDCFQYFKKKYNYNPTKFDEYLFKITKEQRTKNGVFGIEIAHHQLNSIIHNQNFWKILNHDKNFIFVHREEILEQSVSLFKAQQTNQWHILDEKSEIESIQYDGDKLFHAFKTLVDEEIGLIRFFSQLNIKPLSVTYNEITSSPVQVIKKISVYLDVNLPDDINFENIENKKMASKDEVQETIRKFIDDYGDGVNYQLSRLSLAHNDLFSA